MDFYTNKQTKTNKQKIKKNAQTKADKKNWQNRQTHLLKL